MMNLDCSFVAEAIDKETEAVMNELEYCPYLMIVRDGNDFGDEAYINAIKRKANKLGIIVEVCKPTDQAAKEQDADGIICMSCYTPILPIKDVDGLDVGSLYNPCTAEAIVRILEHHGVEMVGSDATVVGRSKRVGLPVSRLLIAKDATVTVCHSETRKIDLRRFVYGSDIVVSAVGKPNLFDGDLFSSDVVIVDVGMGTDKDGKLAGDVSESEHDDFVYIGPREVGKVTTSVLLNHVAKATVRQ